MIYVRGTAFGPRGPDAGRGGYDAGAYWARTGMQHVFTAPGAEWPASPRPAFGDVVGGLTIAGAIGIALYRRATTGEPSLVDASLLASGMWQVQVDIMNAALDEGASHRVMPRPVRHAQPPHDALPDRGRPVRGAPDAVAGSLLAGPVQGDRAAGDGDRPALRRHRRPRAGTTGRASNGSTESSPSGTSTSGGACSPTSKASGYPGRARAELPADPQVRANGYVTSVDVGNGVSVPMVPSPVQFDEQPGRPTRAPEHGEHTESVLLELGLSWAEVEALKDSRAIL